MVSESWFHSLLKTPGKREASPPKALVGVLTFEVASLMSKLIHLWRFLSDDQIIKLREEISNSVGLKKLLSDDDDHIVRLICAELVQNLTHLAKSVARLGRKCSDPGLKSFEHVFSDLIQNGISPSGWLFSLKKMERKMKKMERFISVAASLYQETEALSDLERTPRRMKGNEDLGKVCIVEFQKKVAQKRLDLKNLRELSLWNKTYDYTVFLLARSLLTVFFRIKHVFGIEEMVDSIPRYRSVAATLLQSFLAPSKNGPARFASGPLRKSNMTSKGSTINNYFSGSLAGSVTRSGPLSRKDQNVSFYSGPLRKASAIPSQISETEKNGRSLWLSSFLSPRGNSKKLRPKPNRSPQVEPLGGPAISSCRSPAIGRQLNVNSFQTEILDRARDSSSDLDDPSLGNSADVSESLLNLKSRLLDAPPETLGATALSLHYANVIIVIEKLAACPHLIAPDARDDLYNMLPSTIRTSLRSRLKPFSKGLLTSSIYDTVLAAEWREAMMGILDWLSPLAHNTIRWQSERSFEQQNIVSRTNVLLVQTLYFANQEKMEAIITELLVGLNYIWRFSRELDAKALLECTTTSIRIYDQHLDLHG